MPLTHDLAELAAIAVDETAANYLRALTATNMAAAIGHLGASARLIDGFPLDPGTPGGAGFIFGAKLHARTQDDFHPLGRVHVGAVALASALALADRVQSRTLESLAAGYQVMSTIAVVYAADAQRKGFRPSGLFGPLASAATAATALGLDREGVANAIGLAAARSGGTNQSWIAGTDEWLLEVGYAVRSGIEAALLTEFGVRAAPDALEGKAGWARALFDDAGATRLVDAMKTAHCRIREVAVKPFPVSGIAQVATHLACEVHTHTINATPDEVTVKLSPAEAAYPGSANRGPFRSRSDALMSVAFCVAAGLADGFVSLNRLENPNELAALIQKVTLEPDPQLEERQASLEFLVSGRRLTLSADASSLLHPEWASLKADVMSLAARSEAEPARVASVCDALSPTKVDARRLRALLESAA